MYKVRDIIRAKLTRLNKTAEKLNVTPPTHNDFKESKRIILEYRLLLSYALITGNYEERLNRRGLDNG
ncbi:hypothetical protein PYJP_12790 [Pyrofollis japonicus]|uniref:hypothetical protein n=1 Tax=Pyrofollis japonicus TaxID=3060460 RepID=UPI00295BCC8C|nr:hypothetical protein [Pyrofollis japonicus]BEP17927.1 hypothetical protein PYJP_12790 [Pyrofollis japonicus]